MQKAKLFVALSLSLLVILGSSGFVLSAHFCGGSIQHVSFFGEAASCHQQTTCHQSAKSCCAKDQEEKSDCCHNEEILADADIEYHTSAIHYDLQDQVLTTKPLFELLQVTPVPAELIIDIVDPPPKRIRLHVVHQVFRC